jgi:hypothetical protein
MSSTSVDGNTFGRDLSVMTRSAMTSALTLLLFWGAPSLAAAQDAPAQAPRPTFRSTVDVVSVAAVVRDKRGRFVRNLRKEDFVV